MAKPINPKCISFIAAAHFRIRYDWCSLKECYPIQPCWRVL